MDATADKLTAARHEAGHLTVCLVLGGMDCDAAIGRRDNRWDGESNSIINVSDPPNARQIHGIAGITAELWSEHPHCSGAGVLEHFRPGALEPSEGDMAFFSDGATKHAAIVKAADEAILILRRNVAFWSWAVETLLERHAIADDEAWQRFNVSR